MQNNFPQSGWSKFQLCCMPVPMEDHFTFDQRTQCDQNYNREYEIKHHHGVSLEVNGRLDQQSNE